jgi:hypothetical protein
MLLHQIPSNDDRDARGAPAVNSIWFWGCGSLPALAAPPWSHVWADNVLAQGLALAFDCGFQNLPALPDWRMLEAGMNLLCVPRTFGADVWHEGQGAWRAWLETLESGYLSPVLTLLRSGRIDELCLITEQVRYTVHRSDLLRFWRLRQPLAAHSLTPN